jgi:hypothetical protein
VEEEEVVVMERVGGGRVARKRELEGEGEILGVVYPNKLLLHWNHRRR